MSDDAECLRTYSVSRDQTAFSEFVRRNLDLVYSAAYRQTHGDVHLAEDITQRVFATAATQAAALARHPVVAAWLHRTTRNATIDALRSRQRRQAREDAASLMTEMLGEPEPVLDWEKVSPELDKIVAALAERDREAVILRFFREKSFAEIGAQLDLTENAARMRVERALEKMRGQLARKGIISSAAALSAILVENAVIAAPAGLSATSLAVALSAPAASSLVSVLGIIKIMSATKITASIATAVALVSFATAVHEYSRARGAEQALADVSRTVAPPRHQITTTEPEPAKAPAQPAPAPQGNGAAAGTPKAPSANSPFAAALNLLSSPAMQAQTSIQAKIRLDGQYAPLFKNLNLQPDQLDQFKNLLVEKQMVGFDSMSAAHEQGLDLSTNMRGFFQAFAAAEKTVDTQIVSLLGDDGYSQFQQYQKTVPARNTSNLLSQAMSFTSTPLTNEQTNSVIQILTEQGTPPLPIDNPFAVLNADLGITKLSEQGRAQLQAVLAPPQFKALDEKIQQQLQLLQARAKMAP